MFSGPPWNRFLAASERLLNVPTVSDRIWMLRIIRHLEGSFIHLYLGQYPRGLHVMNHYTIFVDNLAINIFISLFYVLITWWQYSWDYDYVIFIKQFWRASKIMKDAMNCKVNFDMQTIEIGMKKRKGAHTVFVLRPNANPHKKCFIR